MCIAPVPASSPSLLRHHCWHLANWRTEPALTQSIQAAAVGVGALLNGRIDVTGKRVATVITGASIESAVYLSIIQAQLERRTGL